ncbi:hypothetical protein AAU61_05470 [Desulfocarbo indianensis]|nr:hypothetical protein AAU61_05470 [Desulfocarbo indianensis]
MTIKTPAFPSRLTLELTNQCNYKCAMCPSRFDPGEAKGMMEPKLFKRLVDEASGHLPVALVPFFRGESLLHPAIANLIAYAKGKGLGPVQLASNGLLLSELMAKRLLDAGLDFISFSLDTMDELEYRRIRKGGDLPQVLRNVRRFLRLRDQGGYATTVQVSATRTGLNQESMQKFIAAWQNVADRVRIYYEHSADGHTGSLPGLGQAGPQERLACQKPFSEMVVYHNGQAALCNHDWYRDPPLGDVGRSGIQAVWQGEAYARLRGQHKDPAGLSDATCLHCDHWRVHYLENQLVGELYLKEQSTAYA